MKLFTTIGFVLMILLSSISPLAQEAAATSSSVESTSYLTPYQLSWVDEFDSATLDSRWDWIRPNNDLWSLTAKPGTLQITSSGSLFQNVNNQENILITSAPNGDYRVTTRVQTTPTEDFHGAVLYVYQDDDNFVGVARIYNSNNGGANVALRTQVDNVSWSYYVPVTQDDILLRIVKEGGVYSGWFSEDNGATWNFIEQLDADFTDPKVSLSVRMGPTETPLTANFDWIKLDRVVYNSTWGDSFDSLVLDPHWSWRREDDSLWSLSANPGRMQIISSGTIYRETPNNQKNILLTDAPIGDFKITSGVIVSPTEHIHGATLYVYQDDDNYISLARVYSDSHGQSVVLVMEDTGAVNTIYVEDVSAEFVRLRIDKEGDTYSGWFSYDGIIWNYIGQYTLALNHPKIGISAQMGVTTTPVTTEWLYFRVDSYMEQIFLPVSMK